MELKKFNRYAIYIFSLFLISLGAALSIKANLGTAPLISIPYVCSLISKLSVGTVTFIFNVILISIQIILLRRDFEKRQLLQIVMGTIFSVCIDFSLMMVSFVNPVDYLSQMVVWLLHLEFCWKSKRKLFICRQMDSSMQYQKFQKGNLQK